MKINLKSEYKLSLLVKLAVAFFTCQLLLMQKMNAQNIAIGQTYEGGILFYDDHAGHGLVAATVDSNVFLQWGCSPTIISGTSTATGTGQANTNAILTGCSSASIAARYCDTLTKGGFTDWFLPSKDELNLIWTAIGQGSTLNNAGQFSNVFFWSSSQQNDTGSWSQDFNSGFQYMDCKTNFAFVVPVRVVTLTCAVNIPDANFRSALLANTLINTNGDGFIQCTEASSFTGTINVNGLSIFDLTGIEAFVNLTSLQCNNDSLSSLDLTSNTHLQVVNCNKNKLTSLKLPPGNVLQSINCSFNQLTSLDLSAYTGMFRMLCSNNLLTRLNVKNGNNTAVANTNFTALNNPSLTCIQVDNASYASTHWFNKDAGASYSTNCLGCIVNIPDSSFKAALLQDLSINTNGDSEIQCGEASAYSGMIFLSDILNLDLTGIEAFTSLTDLEINYSPLKTINLSFNTHLTTLRIYGCSLVGIDLSHNTLLTTIALDQNLLSRLDVSHNTLLSDLSIDENQISTLDLSTNVNLGNLSCIRNPLSSIDLTHCINLSSLFVEYTPLTEIDLTHNTQLQDLYFHDNAIKSIDLSHNVNLVGVALQRNPDLVGVDFSHNPHVGSIDLNDCNLRFLNLKNGHTASIGFSFFTGNPQLTCIQVDAVTSFPNWEKDPWAHYSTNCNYCLDNVIGGGTLCDGSTGVSIGLSNSQLNDFYTLYYNGNVVAGVVGTGDVLDFGKFNQTGTYTVQVTPGSGSSMCTSTISGNATIVSHPSPITPIVRAFGSTDACQGGSVTLSPVSSCATFDGIDDYAYCPLNGASLSQVTVEFWFKKDSTSDAGIFQWADQLASTVPWILIKDAGNGQILYYVDGNYRGYFDISFGEWTHVALTYDGSTWTFYKNGNPVSTYTGNIGTLNSDALYFANGYPTFSAISAMDLRVWNKSRTAAEIRSTMNSVFSSPQFNLIADYPMHEGSGTTLHNMSNPANNGTLANGVSWTNLLSSGSGISMLWQPVNETTSSVVVHNPADYFFSITNQYGCTAYDTITIYQPSQPENDIPWANLQWQPSATICRGENFTSYGQIYIPGVTTQTAEDTTLLVEFGINSANTDPATWTTWEPTVFNQFYSGTINDEYMVTTGSTLAAGTYYYTFRYSRKGFCGYKFGGYSVGGGGFWNDTAFVSGVLTVLPSSTVEVNALTPTSVCLGTQVTLAAKLNNTSALQLNGTSQYVNLNALGVTSNTMTFEAWVYANGTQNSASGIVFTRGSTPATGLNFGYLNNTKLGYHWNNSPSTYSWTGGPTYPLNTWFHVALVIEPTKATIYLNGVPYVNTVANTAINFNAITQLAQDNFSSLRRMKGEIDEVRIWSVARTQSQIIAGMYSVPANTSGLIAYYNMDEGSGTTLNDITGHGHTGTTVGSPNFDVITPPLLGVGSWSSGATSLGGNQVISFVPNGTSTYTFSSTAGNGCVSSDSITINLYEPPVFTTVPGNISTINDSALCSGTVYYTVNANGAQPIQYSYTFTGAMNGSGAGTGSGLQFPSGITTVIVTAADACGLSSNTTFTVTVHDVEAPVISCPGDIYINATSAQIVNYTVNGSDNCMIAPRNLITNPGNESGDFAGWYLFPSYSNGWAATDGHSGTFGFTGSYDWEIMSQEIDLVAAGYSSQYLDEAPDIRFSQWVRASYCCSTNDDYFYKIELLDGNGQVMTDYSAGDIYNPLQSSSTWEQVSHYFNFFGPGLRKVRVTIGSKDQEFWWGNYGTVIDDISLTVGFGYSANITSGSIFPYGTTNVVATLSDTTGNMTSCNFNVIIHSLPTGILTASSNSVCPGEMVDLYFQPSVGVGPWDILVNGTMYTNVTANTPFLTVPISAPQEGFTLLFVRDNGLSPVEQDSAYYVLTITTLPDQYWYYDADGDGYGDPINSTLSCMPPPGYVYDNTDCDDISSNGIDIHPGAFDIPGNGIDEDCDGYDAFPLPGASLSFDGFDDYVDLGNSISYTLSNHHYFTVEATVKPANTSGLGCIVGNYFTAGNSTMQFLLRRDAQSYTFWMDIGYGYAMIETGPGTVNVGTWQHVSATWDGDYMKIYLDGALMSSANVAGAHFYNTNNPIFIGNNNIGEVFGGNIDEVRLWNRALCQDEILVDNNCETSPVIEGLMAVYHFDQGLGYADNSSETTLVDNSGNAVTGTLHNFNLNGQYSNWTSDAGVNSAYDCGYYPVYHVYKDADNDGFGDNGEATGISGICTINGFVFDNTDCNDADGGINSGMPEICGNGIDDNCNGQIDEACGYSLEVDAYIEGFMIDASTMNASVDKIHRPMVCDSLIAELHNSQAPYELIYEQVNYLSTLGHASFSFPADVAGNSYYLVIRHRNSILTWSSTPITFSSTSISFDFTLSASQAYGNNLAPLPNGKFAIISGDVDQDGFVNDFDYSFVESALNQFFTGYLPEDITGDNCVESSDYSIIENNLGRGVVHP